MPRVGKSFDIAFYRQEREILGMTIGGGAPFFPCIYIVQVFPKGKVAEDGTLEPGDEITHVNGKAVANMKRVDVASLIKCSLNPVRITAIKLAFDVIEGITLDVLFADFKHRVLDYMSSTTADKIGLTRAMLLNDDFVKRFELLEKNERSFKQLSVRIHDVLKAFQEHCSVNRQIAEVFAELSKLDNDMSRRKTSVLIGEAHRQFTKSGLQFIEEATPVISDMNNFVRKAIPDTRRTIRHYLDIKYIFLSFCLKVQLMDEEEADQARIGAYLPRLASGNIEYRIALRCQYMAKTRFLNMRTNVIEKLYLLDNKRLQDLQAQLCKFVVSMYQHLRQSSMFASGISIQHTTSYSDLTALAEETLRMASQRDPGPLLM